MLLKRYFPTPKEDFLSIPALSGIRWLIQQVLIFWIAALGTALCLSLCSCVSIPITTPEGPGGVIVAVDPTGVTFNQVGKDLWVSKGIPASWFVQTKQGWHITKLQWHDGN